MTISTRLKTMARSALGGNCASPGCKLRERDIAELKILAAKKLIYDIKRNGVLNSLREAEFQVFSQFGDDGIIQYLIHVTGIRPEEEAFIEFGVQDYRESNTRFLLLNDNWRGLILDASATFMERVRGEELYWRHDLSAVAELVDVTNVNGLFTGNGFAGDIGLLSIDVDGNDYWLWRAIHAVNPVIVIVEYNSLFGTERAVTIPYDPAFHRTAAHHSNLYWGCSLKALEKLAGEKGYALVGSNSAGNNAYFVRRDRLGTLRVLDTAQAHVKAKFRESRDRDRNLTFLPRERALREIAAMPLTDVESGGQILVGDLICPRDQEETSNVRAA